MPGPTATSTEAITIHTDRQAAIDFLKTRRSPKLRSLTEPSPTGDELTQMLTIASRVPDHGKLVPWRFIVIQGDRRQHLCEIIGAAYDEDHPDANDAACDEARKRLTHAPLVVAVVYSPKDHPKIPAWEQQLTVGAVCMNLINAARAMGYAGLWLTEWYAFDRRVLDATSVETNERLAGFIHIGTEQDPRDDRVRPELADIVTVY